LALILLTLLINPAPFIGVFDPAERIFLKLFILAANFGVFGKGAG